VTFTELVATAAVGTSQRPVPELPAELVLDPVGDQAPAERLLDAVAATAVVRRASLPVAGDVVAPAAAPREPFPVPPERFTSGLARQLSQLTAEQRDLPMVTLIELVREALVWMQQVGWRLPERLIVPVLQRAVREERLAAAAAGAIGVRGHWLAAANPEWAAAIAAGAVPINPTSLDERVWHEGAAAERLAYLTSFRQRDPDAARSLLEETWAKEAVDERVAFIDLVARTAVPSDEPLLVRAMGDRSARVATAARPGLLRIPGSALMERLRARARLAVTVKRGLLSRTVQLQPPDDDPAATADGLNAGSYSRTPAENRLNGLIAAIPPHEWPALAGVQARDLLYAKADLSWSVVKGLIDAAAFWEDRELSNDLVASGIRTPALLSHVDHGQVARLLEATPPMEVEQVTRLVERWPRPWPQPLAVALGQWLQLRFTGGTLLPGDVPVDIIAFSATHLPPNLARGWSHRLRELAVDSRLPTSAQRTARTTAAALTLRAAMYDDVRTALAARASGNPSHPLAHHQED